MPRIAVYFGLPLLVTILLMFALRPLARGMGLIDRPGGRKMHIGEVPVIGGLAMAGGLAIGALYSHSAAGRLRVLSHCDRRCSCSSARSTIATICRLRCGSSRRSARRC